MKLDGRTVGRQDNTGTIRPPPRGNPARDMYVAWSAFAGDSRCDRDATLRLSPRGAQPEVCTESNMYQDAEPC